MKPFIARAANLQGILAACWIAAIPLWFASTGLFVYFTADDLMNLYHYWSKPWKDLLIANAAWYSPFYRPLGGLFYRGMFAIFGFDPLPFRIACFALLFINLGLLYAFVRKLTGSSETGLLAALIACYHARFDHLYYNSGTVYDLLCFSFYAGGLLCYLYWRKRLVLLALLYICALNAKEMAVTLPVVLFAYELLYHPPGRSFPALRLWLSNNAVPSLWLAALTIPFLVGKFSSRSLFQGVGDYQPHLTLARYFETSRHYFDLLFYLENGTFTAVQVIALWTALFTLAAVLRSRTLCFGAVVALVGMLPVNFITPRGSIFVLYVPFIGWSLYGAGLIVKLVESFRIVPKYAAFALASAGLLIAHVKHSPVPPDEKLIRETTARVHELLPRLAANSRVLFLEDPFSKDEWTPVFLMRLSYGNPNLHVDRLKMLPAPVGTETYDAVLTMKEGRVTGVRVPER